MRLSICIPTHHGRCATLRESVDSILKQITPALHGRVELCISDNASQDGTQDLVAQYVCENPGLIRYRRNPENLGFTRNLLTAVALATGDYCWMFSSDDTMSEDGLSTVLGVLAEHPTLTGMTVNIRSYDSEMNLLPGGGHPAVLLPADSEQAQVFTSPDLIFRNCGSVQGYTSGQVFDRRLWAGALGDIGEDKFVSFSYFPYLYLFGRMVKKRPAWMWQPAPLVNNRTNNDYLSAHLKKNALKYHTLTMEEASRVWGELFGRGSATYHSLMRDNYHCLWNAWALMCSKALSPCTPADELKALVWFTRRLFFLPGFWVTAFPVLLTPRAIPRAGAALALKLGYRAKAQRAAAASGK